MVDARWSLRALPVARGASKGDYLVQPPALTGFHWGVKPVFRPSSVFQKGWPGSWRITSIERPKWPFFGRGRTEYSGQSITAHMKTCCGQVPGSSGS